MKYINLVFAIGAMLALATYSGGQAEGGVTLSRALLRVTQNSSTDSGANASDSGAFLDVHADVLHTSFADVALGAAVPPTFFGVHENLAIEVDSEADLVAEISRVRELNLGTLRLGINWQRLFDVGPECSKNIPQEARICSLDALLARLPARLQVIGILALPPNPCIALYKRDRAAFRRQFADYVAQAVGLLKHRISAWDVWSEPNGAGFDLDPPGHNMWTAEEYFQDVFYPGATTIRRLDPSATIVLGSVALNGVVGHKCKRNGMRSGHPCPPAHRTIYYVRPNFFPDLFAYFNAHPEYKPYSLFDKIGLHPYYWTRFRPGGGRYRKLTYVPPSVMTYGPGGLIPSIAVPQGRSFGVWWTELNEKLRLSIGNTQEGQAKLFHDILEQALVDSRRKDFPLQLVDWFSLRDRGCPSRQRACMARERDRNGNWVRHIKWSGLIAYGTRGEPLSHIPRKVFYAYKHFVADHTRIDYLIDDFTSKSVNDEAFDNQFWEPSCTALNTCDHCSPGRARATWCACRHRARPMARGPRLRSPRAIISRSPASSGCICPSTFHCRFRLTVMATTRS